jgi:integrase
MLISQAEKYLASRSVSEMYAKRVRSNIRCLTEFAGGIPSLGGLSYQLVNRWLSSLVAKGLNARTVNGYRQAVFSVWHDAFMDGLTDTSPLRVRRLKVPSLLVRAYTRDEICALIEATSRLTGLYCNGVQRQEFWRAAVLLAYDSGLRRGDLLTLRLEHIEPDGTFAIVQSKTGQVHRGKLRPETLAALARLPHPKDVALPWPHRIEVFSDHFARLKRAAGVKRGTLKWVRRATGSHAEKRNAGDGAKILGHADPRVFDRFYRDRTIADDKPIEPPPL